MTVKTTRISYTTQRLTRPLAGDPNVRAAGGALLIAVVLFAIVISANMRALHEAEQVDAPQVEYVYIIATPTAAPVPTAEPVMLAAPATAEPQVIYATVEVPVYVEVQSAPAAPAAEEWHAPLILPSDVCAAWHPPLVLPEGC